MPFQDTPPQSPIISGDGDEDNEELDENDVIEVYELDDDEFIDDNTEETEGVVEYLSEEETIAEVDNAKIVFKQHKDEVLCCAFPPKSNTMAASGGVDDVAHIWNVNDGNIMFTCKGHEDSVEAVSFNYDGTYLATGDLKGVIKVWKTSDFSLATTFELDDELSWLQWHHGTNVIVAASLIGMVFMYKVPSGDCKMVLAPMGQSCSCGKIFPDGKRLACGFQNGYLKIIDLKQGTILHEMKPNSELGSLTCLDIYKDNNLIIGGYEDGSVLLFNSQSGKIACVLNQSQNQDGTNYVEAIGFAKERTLSLAASGSEDGSLLIWDIAKQTIRHKFTFSSAVNQLIWHPNLPLVYISHVDGVARCCDAKSGQVLKEYLGHTKCVLCMALSNDGSLLMTSSEDKSVRIFSVEDL